MSGEDEVVYILRFYMDAGIVEAEVDPLGGVGTLVTPGGTVLTVLVGAVLIRVEVKTVGDIGTLVNNIC